MPLLDVLSTSSRVAAGRASRSSALVRVRVRVRDRVRVRVRVRAMVSDQGVPERRHRLGRTDEAGEPECSCAGLGCGRLADERPHL
eukprot:scaffold55382_cov96-Phaeocystis_antarctica.AAC.2